jgi:hypothetical protein
LKKFKSHFNEFNRNTKLPFKFILMGRLNIWQLV